LALAAGKSVVFAIIFKANKRYFGVCHSLGGRCTVNSAAKQWHNMRHLAPTHVTNLRLGTRRQCLFLEYVMKKYQCIVCGWIYDEAEGWPQDGIAAGTKWEDIPDDWTCPDCGVSKEDFEMVEI
jgi:rubredoxin